MARPNAAARPGQRCQASSQIPRHDPGTAGARRKSRYPRRRQGSGRRLHCLAPIRETVGILAEQDRAGFHTAGPETREVVDKDSDLGFYLVDTGQVYTVPQVSRPDRLGDFPVLVSRWPLPLLLLRAAAMDGQGTPLQYDKVQYDLDRIAYDPPPADGARWKPGRHRPLGKSISLPRISPDGRFLMFTGHDYGSFPIFQPSSDLYMVDLSQIESLGKVVPRRLDEINSPRADSFHSWSSNGRWVIFTSKRDDGVFSRLYIAHLEARRPLQQTLRDSAAGPRFLCPMPDEFQPARTGPAAGNGQRGRVDPSGEFNRPQGRLRHAPHN